MGIAENARYNNDVDSSTTNSAQAAIIQQISLHQRQQSTDAGESNAAELADQENGFQIGKDIPKVTPADFKILIEFLEQQNDMHKNKSNYYCSVMCNHPKVAHTINRVVKVDLQILTIQIL